MSMRVPMAAMKLRTSKVMTPRIPTTGRSIPAATGAKMPEADWERLFMPWARAYCSLGSIMVMAAEKAGKWKAWKAPAKAVVT